MDRSHPKIKATNGKCYSAGVIIRYLGVFVPVKKNINWILRLFSQTWCQLKARKLSLVEEILKGEQ